MKDYLFFKPLVKCDSCGYLGKSRTKQSEWWTLLLWQIFLPAAICYEIFRNTKEVCPKCGSNELLIVDTYAQANWLRKRDILNNMCIEIMIWLSAMAFMIILVWYVYSYFFGIK